MTTKKLLPHLLTLALAALLVVTQQVWASPVVARLTAPTAASSKTTINYQGILSDASGAPVTSQVDMIFRLYNVETAGTALWTETQTAVSVSEGLFSVLLGSVAPLSQSLFDSNANLWLGITIGSDPDELTPREKLASAPFALAGGAAVPVGAVISWWRPDANTPVPSDKWAIADGSIVNDPESPLNGQRLPNLTDSFVMGVAPASIGATGGQNTLNLAHNHTVDAHSHTVDAHSHTVAAHSHGINDHSHTVNNHAHSLPSHNHNIAGQTSEVFNFWDGGYFRSAGAEYRFAVQVYSSSAWYYRHDHRVDLGTSSWNGTSGEAAPATSTVSLTTSPAAPETSASAPGTSLASPGTSAALSGNTENRPAFVGLVYLVRIK